MDLPTSPIVVFILVQSPLILVPLSAALSPLPLPLPRCLLHQTVPSIPAITTNLDKECNVKEISAPNLRPSEAEPSLSNPSSRKTPSVPITAAEILSQEHFGFDCTANVPQPSFSNYSNQKSHASGLTAAVSPVDVAPTTLAPAPEEFAQTSRKSRFGS
jgi:hypothetical protein